MVTIRVDGDKDPELLLMYYAEDIREHAVKAIKESYELELDEAYCVEFEVHGEDGKVGYMDFTLTKDKWLGFLADSIEPLIEKGDFELLVEVRELMRKLQE
jgi:hypothetical protein